MKTYLSLILLTIIIYGTSCQSERTVSSNDKTLAVTAVSNEDKSSLEQKLIELENALFQAQISADVALADSVLGQNYKEIFPDGSVVSRDRKLQIIEQHPRETITDFTLDEFKIDIYENSAVLYYLSKYSINNEQPVYKRVMVTYVYEKDRWRSAGKQISADLPIWSIRKLNNDELELVTALDCEDEADLKSSLTSDRSLLRFRNNSEEELTVQWIDFDGERDPNPYYTLAPGESGDINTFVTHPFVISRASGECMGIYQATIKPGLVVIQ